MKNGKVLTLYTTPLGFLMGLWRNLFKEPKDLGVLKMPFVLLQKDEHLGWVYWDGTPTSKKRAFLSRVCWLSLKLGKYFRKLKLKVKELLWTLLKFMVNLFGALVLVIVTPILGLLLLLCLIVSLAVMLVLALSLGPLMFSRNKARRVRSLGKTPHS